MSEEDIKETSIETPVETSMEEKETGDYPFKSWGTFIQAFNTGLNTEFFEEEYPKYGKILDKYSNYDIIRTMVKKYNLDVDDGLYDYIYTLCYTGVRYADAGYDPGIINFFIQKGAKFPIDLLFDSESDYFNSDVEEEFYSYNIRGTILDNFGKKLQLDVSEYADWKNIEAKHIDK